MEQKKHRAIERLSAIGYEITLLKHSIALLEWDQETYMPSQAIEERSEQLSLLQTILHKKSTCEEIGELLDALDATDETPAGEETLVERERAVVKVFFRDYSREKRIPTELVTELSRQTSIAQNVWVEARKQNDFTLFAPKLSTVVSLVKEKAAAIGYIEHPYDPLLDEYEPEMKTERVKTVFQEAADDLKELIDDIRGKTPVDETVLKGSFPLDKQKGFGNRVLTDMGFDDCRSRLDISAHPFTTSLGSNDVRLTTRYRNDYFNTGFFGIVHEGGHGLYELGYDEKIHGTILADGASLGIHESQSRMWENIIARSRAFWTYYFPILKTYFPDQFDKVPIERFYRAVNSVKPSLIRVEADEVTYNLHIMLRFSLECDLITGDLCVSDLPEAWNALSRELIGLSPETNADGVLQDIHWSMGGMGYFPTYALGNFYAAQFFAAMRRDLKDIEDDVAMGNLHRIRAWLRDKIHRHGRMMSAEQLCEQVTGEVLNSRYFVQYLRGKYSDIYEL